MTIFKTIEKNSSFCKQLKKKVHTNSKGTHDPFVQLNKLNRCTIVRFMNSTKTKHIYK